MSSTDGRAQPLRGAIKTWARCLHGEGVLLLTLIVLSQAPSPAEYPKVSRRDGKICVQVLNAKGAVEESCRAEGSEARTPLPAETAEGSVVHPIPSRPAKVGLSQPAAPPAAVTASQIYWAEAKREWGLAFKFGAVTGLASTLANFTGWLIASGSGVAHAGDSFLYTGIVTGIVTAVCIVAGVLIDRWGHEEIVPSPPAPEESSD